MFCVDVCFLFCFLWACVLWLVKSPPAAREVKRETSFLNLVQSVSHMNEVRFNWSSSILCDVILFSMFFHMD